MFSLFKKTAVKTTSSRKGSHGDHWYTLYAHNTPIDDIMRDTMQKLEASPKVVINKTTTIFNDAAIRAIQYKNTIISGFPHWKGTHYEQVETKLITEWSHAKRLEAVVTVIHPTVGNRLDFFATDYAFHSETYKSQKNISVNIVGLAYFLESVDMTAMNTEGMPPFSANFCGYVPSDTQDEIEFIGRVLEVREHNLGNISGYIATICPVLDEQSNPAMTLDIFVAKSNLRTELNINQHVTGLVWLIGTLEK